METAIEINITYDGGSEKIYCEKISDTIYRCLESCVFIDFITYGCEIEVEEKDSELVFLWLYKESPYKMYRYALTKALTESEKMNEFKKKVIAIGGYWEIVMGGILFFHIPKEKDELTESILKILD